MLSDIDIQKTEEFIQTNYDADVMKLYLNRDKFRDININLCINTIEGRKRIANKISDWAGKNLLFNNKLCLEQCSSKQTAEYKANIIQRLDIQTIVDLTGGLGVDSYYLSKICQHLDYNERNKDLFECVKYNFNILGIKNVDFHNIDLDQCNIDNLFTNKEFDLIFIDPARRDDNGKKVFLLEDCSPNIKELQDYLLSKSKYVLIKLSPMLDLSLVQKELKNIFEIHIVGYQNECKELLILLKKDYTEQPKFFLVDDNQVDTIDLDIKDAILSSDINKIKYVYEPSKCLNKSMRANNIAHKYNLYKMSTNTNLYYGDTIVSPPHFKKFKVLDIQELNKQSIKNLYKEYPNAGVSAKNIMIKSEDLQKKLKIKDGGNLHIFGCLISQDRSDKKYLIVCQKLDD